VVTVVLGALLGAADLNAPEVSGWLRVPALIAALILVAQGLLDFENARRAQQMHLPLPDGSLPALNPTPSVPLHADDVILEDGSPQSASVALEHAIQAQALAARLVAGTTVRESSGAVMAVLVLAVWLGLATLSYSSAPGALLTLSLIASFLLFASAWSMLQKRRA
jgi:uncharacterized membrane protein